MSAVAFHRRQQQQMKSKQKQKNKLKPREAVISRRRQQRALNGLGLEPWRLLLALDTGVGIDVDEFRLMFQEPIFSNDHHDGGVFFL
jgi:hypothetical protein